MKKIFSNKSCDLTTYITSPIFNQNIVGECYGSGEESTNYDDNNS